MKVTYLDVGATHGEGSSCPANKFVMLPNGSWQCFDYGLQIMWKTIEVVLARTEPLDDTEAQPYLGSPTSSS